MSEMDRDTAGEESVAVDAVNHGETVETAVSEPAQDERADGVAEVEAAGGDRQVAEAIATLEADLAAARSQANEYLDQWRRSAAEFQNFRKRQERERQEFIKSANAELLTRLLPVLDDLQRAIQHVPEELRENEWVNGVLLIERKLWQVLEQAGVEPVEASPGTVFDPSVHDAVVAEPSETIPPGHITSELERGYRLHEKVLRPAKVAVAR